MGEAKRRQKLDPSFSKGFGASLTIRLIERAEVTSERLIEAADTVPFNLFGEISNGNVKQQCGLIPETVQRKGKTVLSCHLIFVKPQLLKLNQREIDRLSTIAARQILKNKISPTKQNN